MISSIEVGTTYTSGNTFRPDSDSVEALGLSFAELPAREQNAQLTIRYWEHAAVKADSYVRYRSGRRVSFTAEETFKATRYGNLDAMCAHYAAQRRG